MPPDSTAIDRIRAYCHAKPGLSRTLSLVANRDRFQFLSEYYSVDGRFAEIDWESVPALMELHLPDIECQRFKDLYPEQIEIIPRRSWNRERLTRVRVRLDGKIPEVEIAIAIDRAYAEVYAGLEPHSKEILDICGRNLPPLEMIDALAGLYDLNHRIAEIRTLVRPSIRLKTSAERHARARIGQSKIGGLPDLPDGVSWPQFDGRPLAFLTQINLAEIPREIRIEPLPDEGILYFFSVFGWKEVLEDEQDAVDISRSHEPGFSRVLFVPAPLSVLRRSRKPRGGIAYRSAAVQYISKPSLPIVRGSAHDEALAPLDWPDAELDRLDMLHGDFEMLIDERLESGARHQMLGYAGSIQDKAVPRGSRLLFQLASDYEQTGMEIGDGGLIYFYLPESDFALWDLSRITAEMQSG